jgi:diadenosine tetraphosphate (Ap4A) HIT family hydrolase
MTTLIHERVAAARRGENATVIGRMASGWAVLGDVQLPLGYALLLPDPVVGSINDLAGGVRERFLADMVALGDALLAVTPAYRINYEILGNGDQALHAHVFARYSDEDPVRIKGPVWTYGAERDQHPFDPVKHGALMRGISHWLRTHGLIDDGGSRATLPPNH